MIESSVIAKLTFLMERSSKVRSVRALQNDASVVFDAITKQKHQYSGEEELRGGKRYLSVMGTHFSSNI